MAGFYIMATLAFSKLGKSTFSFLSFFAIHQELRLDFFFWRKYWWEFGLLGVKQELRWILLMIKLLPMLRNTYLPYCYAFPCTSVCTMPALCWVDQPVTESNIQIIPKYVSWPSCQGCRFTFLQATHTVLQKGRILSFHHVSPRSLGRMKGPKYAAELLT